MFNEARRKPQFNFPHVCQFIDTHSELEVPIISIKKITFFG